tara:strand:+ start:144 stop:521 length:378 start_codon:yes stop_codon:yes gene_type:complete
MAHFAKINSNNIVEVVHVVNNAVITKEDGTEDESKGKDFLDSLFGPATWVQTSYNNNFRKNYAGVGYTYDSVRDAFIPPKPYNSWVLNEDTCQWEAPVEFPDVNNRYNWNEENQEWDYIGPALPE